MSEAQPVRVEDSPASRLARHGASVLSERELLSLLGVECGDLRELAMECHDGVPLGLPPAAGRRVAAALELGRRLRLPAEDARPRISASADAARYLLPRYGDRPVETFGLLALDVRQRLRRECEISTGCLTSSLVHPREVFRAAILARAVGVLLFHNHPSGDPEPSAEDIALTRRLASAGTLLGIPVLDHVVLGAGRYVSLKDRGLL